MDRWDETWHRLLEWTNGQGPSERLAAQILYAVGFTDIDPAHPLGGPDGGRDAMCTRDGERWIMAVYFPRGQQSLSDIRTKLVGDLAAARKHNPDGVAFVTNQELKLAERRDLEKLGDGVAVEIYHLDRITSVLDQPDMAPVRRQFLRIDGGQPEIAVDLAIDGAAPCLTDGAEIREAYLDLQFDKARERAAEYTEPTTPYGLNFATPPTFKGLAGLKKQLTEDELEGHLDTWAAEVRAGWRKSEDHLAAAAGPALHFTLTNRTPAMLNDVQVVITIARARALDWVGPEQFHMSKLLPPVFPQSDPLAIGFDAARLRPMQRGDRVSWKNRGDTVVVTIDIDRLRPHPPWESPRADLVLVPLDDAPTELTAEWTLTAQGYGEAYLGRPVTIAVEARTVSQAVAIIQNHQG